MKSSYNPILHHRRSIRHKAFDYATPGDYFVTICTREQECMFGEIVDGKMRLSKIGQIAKQCWVGIPDHFSNVRLDESEVMPNHVHGILRVKSRVGTRHAVSLQRGRRFGKPIRGSISTIIGSFKSVTSKISHEVGFPDFAWQSRFHDHIIRNERDYFNHLNYIYYNAVKHGLVRYPEDWPFMWIEGMPESRRST